jgi:pimeloyl-ACP methyl ester carboxylesterase
LNGADRQHPVSAPPTVGGLHDDHIIDMLRSGAHAALLSAYFGEQEYRELCLLAKLAAIRRDPRGPAVFLLPGIMGSKLGSLRGKAVELLWLHPGAVSAGGMLQLALPGTTTLTALGVMLPGYLKLKLSLEIAGFTAIFHAFDWRQDLATLGQALNAAIEEHGSRSVSIVGHSMGGLVARAALADDAHGRIAKLIQLGAPNAGSFAPVQALRAVYPTVRKIAALDSSHTAETLAEKVFHTLPGLYALLPSRQDAQALDLFDRNAWPGDRLRPDATLLDQARAARERLPRADERCFTVAGVGQETITSVEQHESGFSYRITRHGDGTVPVPLAEWSGSATWYVDANHGAMTNDNRVIAAVIDLLSAGKTNRLSKKLPSYSYAPLREISDGELRASATHKVEWDSLSLDSRRRILEPVISPEFLGR